MSSLATAKQSSTANTVACITRPASRARRTAIVSCSREKLRPDPLMADAPPIVGPPPVQNVPGPLVNQYAADRQNHPAGAAAPRPDRTMGRGALGPTPPVVPQTWPVLRTTRRFAAPVRLHRQMAIPR